MATTITSGVQYSGIWTMQQVNSAIAAGTWPVPPAPKLYSWGSSFAGQLGLGNTTSYSSPKQVGTLTAWLNVAAGEGSSLATKTDGTLWSWGNNSSGQLGLGNTTNYSSPKQIGALTTWSIVNIVTNSAFAIKTDGTLWAWGGNGDGQLGLNSATASYSSPKQVGSLTNWSGISSNGSSTLAIKTDGTLWSWGSNTSGQLGLGNITSYSSPKQIGALTSWSQVSSANSALSIVALKTDGTIWSWGSNTNGQLGLGNTTNYSSPKQIGALTTWTTVVGFARSLMAIKGGALWSWGKNQHGQLGLGNITYYSSPKQVGSLTGWLSLSGGFYAVTSIKTDGTAWSWGRGNNGVLGLGNTTSYSSPKQIGSLTTWLKLTGGAYHALGIAVN
jgi:alpha-tubulin suppressor-like RCC1 family protein